MKKLVQQLGYVLDEARNIWLSPNYEGIAYSDGNEVEARIADVIQNATDISILTTEFRRHCVDWPSLYHLSGTRANILRPFENNLKADVLAIGAGCGAITRYLGECGGNILALEGSPRRAAIARARTRDLENVIVLSERFDNFRCSRKFDVITLIGVLEYANLFTAGDNPPLAMLGYARSMLKPNGKLIIAIENQLGLKYFSGAPEDHLGQPMVGVEGRYRKDQPQTFGREVLADMLIQAGFTASEFLAPFPDYKLPTSIITTEGFQDKNFDASAFAWQSVQRDPQLPLNCNFSLELVWPEIFKNDLGLHVANSFLVVASLTLTRVIGSGLLAYHYSTERVPKYCKETRFQVLDHKDIGVIYTRLGESPKNELTENKKIVSFECPKSDQYRNGKVMSWEFIQIVTRDGWAIDEVGEYFQRYISVIRHFLSKADLSVTLASPYDRLPGKFFDLIPQNLIIKADLTPVSIDEEWSLSEQVELGHLLFRCLLLMLASVTRFGQSETENVYTRGEFVHSAFAAAGFAVTERDCARYIDIESLVQEEVLGRPAHDFLAWWPHHILPMQNLNQAVVAREVQIASLVQAVHDKEIYIGTLDCEAIERKAQIARLVHAVYDKEVHIKNIELALNDRHHRLANIHIDVNSTADYLAELLEQIRHQNAQLIRLGEHATGLEESNRQTKQSLSWRLTAPVRWVGKPIVILMQFSRPLAKTLELGGGLTGTMALTAKVLREEGVTGVMWRLGNVRKLTHVVNPIGTRQGTDVPVESNNYEDWVQRYDSLNDTARKRISDRIGAFARTPKISVVMPVYDPPLEFLDAAIWSVRKQLYANWELCMADDASKNPLVRELFKKHEAEDSRIKVVYRQQNGHISVASNSALERATGEFVALLDHDDLLSEHALFWVADAIQKQPDAGLIYSDEDKISENDSRYDPYFTSDLNPELLLAQNMICHLAVFKRQILSEIGGFQAGYEGAQDYDLVLRVIECIRPDQVVHIPRVLYHWRAIVGSTALAAGEKDYAADAGRRAVVAHLERLGKTATVTPAPSAPTLNRVRFVLPDPLPLVSIIIPTSDRVDLLSMCVNSILHNSSYPALEILIIDNGSVEPETLRFFEQLPSDRLRVIRDDGEFNFSRLNNFAAGRSNGGILCLMNNDIEVLAHDWLEEIVSFAAQPEIGCVGARLWYPDGRLQQGGVILGVDGVAGHAHKYASGGDAGYFGRAELHQSYSAVTAACLVVRRDVYAVVNGLDETLAVAFNDIDFCLRVKEAGYRNVWTPYAAMIHHESVSRGIEDTPEKQARINNEVDRMKNRWGDKLSNDPTYNPNLTLNHEDFSLAWPPRVELITQ
jgi:GT2 family glycosyltransferase/SAM-dependent methyltransferase